MRKLIILDRDGTINEDTGFTHRLEDLKLLPGVIDALKALQNTGFSFRVVTNQSGIGRGYYKIEDMERFNRTLSEQLRKSGVKIDAFYFCPHTPDDGCTCRKPSPYLIKQAMKDAGADPSKTYVIGDRLEDGLAGKNAGAKTVLVKTGPKTPPLKEAVKVFDYICENLFEAAEVILNAEKIRKNIPV